MKKSTETSKRSFILHHDFHETLFQLSDEQAGIVFKSIFHWQINGELPEIDFALKMVLSPLITQFKRDNSKWDKISEIRSGAGTKGVKKKLANAKRRKQKLANVSKCDVSVSVSGSVSDSVNVSEEDTPLTPQGGSNDYTPDFELFWKAYPRKVGKLGAFRAFQRIKSKPPVEELVRAIEAHARSEAWTRDGGQFIPHPQTWLNQGRWDDEIEHNQPAINPENI